MISKNLALKITQKNVNLNYLSLLALFVFLSGCARENLQQNDTGNLRLGAWDYDWMQKVRSSLREADPAYQPAFEKLVSDAETALKAEDFSVTYKQIIPPSGTKHDFMSMGPYWWPDPGKENGLPYIRRDGEVNPESQKLDNSQLTGMISNVTILSLAWFFTEKREYAEKAARLLRVWFLEDETLMNPNLEFAQSIPGRMTGRGIGIIDAKSVHILVDAITLVGSSGILTPEEKSDIKKWFQRYQRWLTQSRHGKDEDDYINNHSVAYDVQSAGIAYYLEDDDFVAQKVREIPERRIDHMIAGDGSQPHELVRTRAYSYSVGNLRNFIEAGEKGLKVGLNIFDYTNLQGGSIQKALDFLISYVGREKEWPYKQISSWEDTENNLGLLIRRAARIYNSDRYQSIWEDTFEERIQTSRELLVIPGK